MQYLSLCPHHHFEIIFLDFNKNKKLGDRTLCKDCKHSQEMIKIEDAIKIIEEQYQMEQTEKHYLYASQLIIIVDELKQHLTNVIKNIEAKLRPILIQKPSFLDFEIKDRKFTLNQLQQLAQLVSEIKYQQINENVKVQQFRNNYSQKVNECIDELNKLSQKLQEDMQQFQQNESIILLQKSQIQFQKQSKINQPPPLIKQDSKITQLFQLSYYPISSCKLEHCVNSISYYDSLFSTYLICGQKVDDGFSKFKVSSGKLDQIKQDKNFHQVTALQHSRKDNWFIMAGHAYKDSNKPIFEIHKEKEIINLCNDPALFISQIYLNNNEDQIICIGNSPSIHFWQKDRKDFRWNFRYKTEQKQFKKLSCFEINEKFELMFAGDEGGCLILYSTQDGYNWRDQYSLQKAHDSSITSIAILKNDIIASADKVLKLWWILVSQIDQNNQFTMENIKIIDTFENNLLKQIHYQFNEKLLFILIENKKIVIFYIVNQDHDYKLEEVGQILGKYSKFFLTPNSQYIFCYNIESKILESLEQKKRKK